jgi:hypothetical protein
MTEFSRNVYDLNGYRTKKAEMELSFSNLEESDTTLSPKHLDSNISNIKKSIHRINQLMEELRSMSQKDHPNTNHES